MESPPRHQCLIYDGPPSRQLPNLTATLRQRLSENYRCLYLNSPPMIAGIRSYLAATGIDVAQEIAKASLVLSSERSHFTNGRFDLDRMLNQLDDALQQALDDGYAGLWATGDMSWEFGPEKDFAKLVDYEERLEAFFQTHPELGGICQYHAETLPQEALRHGLAAHPAIYVNETLSRINPHYRGNKTARAEATESRVLDTALAFLLRPQPEG
jgi:hypothetical protein